MKILTFLLCILSIQSCAQSTVGGKTHRIKGVEVESKDYCMANCLTKAEDGLHCAVFSKDMASVCKEYLRE